MPTSSKLENEYLSPPVFRVFEHDLLRIGEVQDNRTFSVLHLESLVRLSQQTGNRYFMPGHRSVRFKQFVGILATPALTVEILPKADRRSIEGSADWQRVLIDLLRACQFVRTESPGTAPLDRRSGYLLDWYIRSFIIELQSLLRYGLLHTYQTKKENLGILKGRLQLAKQLKHNTIHRERFYVHYDQFTDRHPANLLINAALQRLRYLPTAPELKAQINYLRRLFPDLKPTASLRPIMAGSYFQDPRLDRYNPALTIARHILQEEQPDIRSGVNRGLALLFDMNLLFEEYIYRQLLQWKPAGVEIERQQSRMFWGRNRLRPDLVISTPEDRWVLDTKWRILPSGQPTADELRQIYVYCDYFNAKNGVLVFPFVDENQASRQQIFSELPGHPSQDRYCRVYFAPVITKKGRLNREMGKELFEELNIVA